MNFNRELPIMFDGKLLNDLITPQFDVDPLLYPETTDATLSFTRGVGEQFNSRKIGTRKIKVPFFMVNPSEMKRQELTEILNVDEPKKLILGRAQDRYYMAIPDGNIETGMAKFQIASTITFICYDPLAYSLTTNTADNKPYKDVPVNLLTGTSNVQDYTLSGSNWKSGSQSSNGKTISIPGTPGASYTYSVNVKTATFNCYLEIGFYDSSKKWIANSVPAPGTGIGIRKVTAKSPENTAFLVVSVVLQNPPDSQTVVFNSEKLEIGTTASPWSPNPADPEYNYDTITVDYQGTATAYPILTATMKSENGLVAFTNDKGGVLQFGNPEEVDTVTKVKSDKVIDDGMRPGQTGYTFNVGPINYAKSVGSGVANTFDGSIKFIGETAEPQFIDDKIKHWHGPSMHRTVPTNSLGDNTGSFIWRTRFNYNTDAKGLGYLEINLTSGNKVIASFAMYDGNSSIVEQKTQYFVNGKQLNAATMNPRLFGNGFYELTVTRNQGKGNFKLSKVAKMNGEEVVPGATYQVPFVDSTFDSAAIDGVTMWFMKFSNSKATSMNISDMKFHWINVPYIEDVPNRFDTGDVVTVDVASRKVYLNGVVDNTLQTVGNQWDTFKLNPGINTIQPVASSWATMYDCKLTYREAWL